MNAAGASARSNAAGAVVTAVVTPAAPSNLFATVANNVITLAWTDNASNETGYRVEKKIGTGAFTTLASKPSNAFSHTDSLSGAGPFAYRVIALGPTESAPSNEAVVSTGNPAADATVRAGTYANTTHGTAATLEGKLNSSISNDRNAYLRFGLTGFSGTVTSAKLRLYGNAATTAKAIGVHAVANTTWVESSITWNTAPAMGTLQQNQTVGLTAGWFEWDITGYVNQQKALGATAISLGLRTTVKLPDGQTTFHSRTGTNRPVLVISSR